ncbi:MAG: hypothetical protein [Caudoviricetes sp.]|nr:MAG: hypothetical protein [Caudoviricetes sp.]
MFSMALPNASTSPTATPSACAVWSIATMSSARAIAFWTREEAPIAAAMPARAPDARVARFWPTRLATPSVSASFLFSSSDFLPEVSRSRSSAPVSETQRIRNSSSSAIICGPYSCRTRLRGAHSSD